MNEVRVQGRTTSEVELKKTGQGKAYVNFNLAVEENFKDAQGEWQKSTTFIECIAWDKQAELLATVKKGSLIEIDGKIEVSKYKNKDNVEVKSTKVRANRFYLVTIPKLPDKDDNPFDKGEKS